MSNNVRCGKSGLKKKNQQQCIHRREKGRWTERTTPKTNLNERQSFPDEPESELAS